MAVSGDPKDTHPINAEGHCVPRWLGWRLRWVLECILEGLAGLVLGW